MAVIALDRLSKRYGSVRGVEGLSFAVEPGEVFGFLGPNGAGKTTTIRLLLDLLRPTSGRATVFGLDSHRDSRAIRARLGNVPGDFTCDPRWTGWDLLRFAAAVRGIPGTGPAAEYAERFDADLTRPLGVLSRGSRQKVGLIHALFHEPELLVLDEPTTGLDPLMREVFVELVGELRGRGHTVFLSSHDLDEVERTCDRVAMVRDGRLIAVEDVGAMRARSYRRVRVSLRRGADVPALAALPGVEALVRDGSTLTFRQRGPLDPLVRRLAELDLDDLEVTRPTLEELFLTRYEGREAA